MTIEPDNKKETPGIETPDACSLKGDAASAPTDMETCEISGNAPAQTTSNQDANNASDLAVDKAEEHYSQRVAEPESRIMSRIPQ